ncbi:GNAT family N-acetyltransferase [Thiospirochaeta perfilievii]|uniref:GNAT family N-acetyltransferase n=1 Tax=Thiospirochaeta perfilievii TaxID=252967 RepID=A0A5C1QE35_9SPIO|nr:GNAT family N-acetyltransferase [Thiospirochaeta perfilievii]QEN05647.1 GNAT family N-acetyltransferase [Thiospirochaeta perfilievii]
MTLNIKIIPISKKLELKQFDCGINELNVYLSQYSIANDKKNIGKTFVAVGEEHNFPLGYYTVSMVQVYFHELTDDIKKSLPKYPIPSMRIGKLAVSKGVQGKRIGAYLLRDSFLRAIRISEDVALKFIVVDALNEKSKEFYIRYGFIPLKDNPLKLVISLDTIKMAFLSFHNL